MNITPLFVGLPGPVLDAAEAKVLGRVRPAGIILFARNIESWEQLAMLKKQVVEVLPEVIFAVDLEGGMVDRFRELTGGLPSAAEAGSGGGAACRALGEAAGAACRLAGIELDLAPVVDLAHPEGTLCDQDRCFAADPELVAMAADAFLEGLGCWGITGCLKHFPGLGPGRCDSHLELPVLEAVELDTELAPFEAVQGTPLVMVSHALLPQIDPERPASLSTPLIHIARRQVGSLVLSDDLEMDALAEFGELADRVLATLAAGCHGALVCSKFDQLEAIVSDIEVECAANPPFATLCYEASSRLEALSGALRERFESVAAPSEAMVMELAKRARSLV